LARQLESCGEVVAALCLIDAPTQGRPRWWRWFQQLTERVSESSRSAASKDPKGTLLRVSALHRAALDKYTPTVYRGTLVAFQAQTRPTGIRRLLDESGEKWLRLSANGSQLQVIPGEHEELFKPGNVEVLAAQLDVYLEQTIKELT
jgi:thioesterase domain-containing protein